MMLQLWTLAIVWDSNGSPLDCVAVDVDRTAHSGRRLAVLEHAWSVAQNANG